MVPRLIILGAGRPFSGDTPSGLRQIDRHRRVLDWILHAFAQLQPDVYFVGGYRIDAIMAEYGKLIYIFNDRWAETGAVASLYVAPLSDDRDHYVCYNDIVFRDTIVERLAALDPSVIGVATDTEFTVRYGGDRQRAGKVKEKVRLDGSRILSAGVTPAESGALGEFVGLLRLPRAVMPKVIALREQANGPLRHLHLSALVEALRQSGEMMRAIKSAGDWSELNSELDLSRFVFGTKAETLDRLRQRLKRSVVDPQVSFSVARWNREPQTVIDDVFRSIAAEQFAVRSSACVEDGFYWTHAGRFQSRLNIPRDSEALARAIADVIASYDDNTENQVFVQSMVRDAQMSGVVFTRSLNSGAPYYTINYVEGSDTASITSGSSYEHHTLIVHRDAHSLPAGTPPVVIELIAAVREIEEVADFDALDIEFAVRKGDEIHILQVRPMSVQHERSVEADERTERFVRAAIGRFEALTSPAPEVCGSRTIWGSMPDWNPAEMIGNRPDRLAADLYSHLITDEVWAIQRSEFGYRDIRPTPLMQLFAGQPYIDIRASFNSFVPATVSETVATRLVDHYIETLRSPAGAA